MSNRAVALAHPPKPGRDWHTYNLAQTREGLLFENLLWDLLQTVPEPEYQGNGRPRLPVRDVLFAAITKMYSRLSSRRHQARIEQAYQDGLLTAVPHFNAVSKLLRNEDIKDVLRELVRLSALPVATVEDDFAVDSTGFATGCYGSYREIRYGVRDKYRKWIKLHAVTGVTTNIITAADALDGHSPDSPQFRPLVEETAKGFEVNEVSADKAYSSKDNHLVVHETGGQAVIPFKSYNKPGQWSGYRGGKAGKLWRRALAYFTLHEDEFYARYHKRSNVEATFGAMKLRFGERLKSKDFTAQCNEVLCKAAAWNICVLVRAMHEHDVPADFSS